ncbi:MAG: division/cell wall cluster transcriptional repressor MraZ [Alphaproteobacteria bacterium]|nr:division/cell wall cluster transcriptional repressor MraZ [Alphaproteobacteria bacterium]
MTLFLSTFINKIDKKGRISVPSTFRAALAKEGFQGIVVFRSYKHVAIEACGMERMQRLSASVDDLDFFSDKQDDLTATIFSDSQQLPFDSEGRVVLPKVLMDHAKITDSAAFIGRGATFQIWHPDTFERHQQQARNRVIEQQMTIRLRPELEEAGK